MIGRSGEQRTEAGYEGIVEITRSPDLPDGTPDLAGRRFRFPNRGAGRRDYVVPSYARSILQGRARCPAGIFDASHSCPGSIGGLLNCRYRAFVELFRGESYGPRVRALNERGHRNYSRQNR